MRAKTASGTSCLGPHPAYTRIRAWGLDSRYDGAVRDMRPRRIGRFWKHIKRRNHQELGLALICAADESASRFLSSLSRSDESAAKRALTALEDNIERLRLLSIGRQ